LAIFGNTADDSGEGDMDTDRIRGGDYTPVDGNGTADSISVRLKRTSAGNTTFKCALYNHATNALVGSTEERVLTLTTSYAWYTFNFTDPKPAIVNGTLYVIVVWVDFVSVYNWLAYSGGAGATDHYRDETYGAWPNPITFNHYSYSNPCIYCTYTPSGGATVKKGSNLANTMTTMLNSKMLFSACNRFPKLSPRRF